MFQQQIDHRMSKETCGRYHLLTFLLVDVQIHTCGSAIYSTIPILLPFHKRIYIIPLHRTRSLFKRIGRPSLTRWQGARSCIRYQGCITLTKCLTPIVQPTSNHFNKELNLLTFTHVYDSTNTVQHFTLKNITMNWMLIQIYSTKEMRSSACLPFPSSQSNHNLVLDTHFLCE